MGAEIFYEMPIHSRLQVGAEGVEAVALPVHAQPVFIESKGADQDFLRRYVWSIGIWLPDIFHTHRGAGGEACRHDEEDEAGDHVGWDFDWERMRREIQQAQ